MFGRILARVVLVLFVSSFAAAAGCGGSSPPSQAPNAPTEKQIKKEGGRIPGSPGSKK